MKTSLISAALIALVSSTPLEAQTIGGNFSLNRTAGTFYDLAPGDVAGVVPQSNWNNLQGSSQTTPQALVNNSGAATTATVTWAANGSWDARGGASTGDNQLLNSYIDDTATAGGTVITFAAIPFTLYDIYVYVGSDGNDRSGHVAINGGAPKYFLTSTAGSFDGTYTEATSPTLVGAARGEYVRFTNVSGSSLAITVDRDSNNVGVHGVQIVSVIPEPVGLGLLGLGALGFLRLRRARKS